MLGLVFLYWIGKYYYRLAEEFEKKEWLYAILGIVSYYGGVFVFGIILTIVMELINPGYIDGANETTLSIIALPFGATGCYFYYKHLQKKWKKEDPRIQIEEIGNS